MYVSLMEPSVYVETSVIGYLAADISQDLIVAAHQRVTHEWWGRREGYRLFVSELVLQEVSAGHEGHAARRLDVVAGLPVLTLREDATRLGDALTTQGPLPANAGADALHIALAAVHGIEFLVTWNMRHIANATMRARIERTCRVNGADPPVLCTPEELLGE